MSEKTLKFDNVRVNKKEFHKSKQPIDLNLVNPDPIIVSDKFKYNNNGFKYFIGYKEVEIVKPLCILLPQMIEYIKNFENRRKNFLSNEVPKENEHQTRIACVTIDSVVRMDNKCCPQVYLEECKYKIKKKWLTT